MAFVLSLCSQGMALQQCPKGTRVQGLLQRLGYRNWLCRQQPQPCPGPGHTKGYCGLGLVQGDRDKGWSCSATMLQVPAGQILCVCQEKGSVKNGLEWSACVPDVSLSQLGWDWALCLLPQAPEPPSLGTCVWHQS